MSLDAEQRRILKEMELQRYLARGNEQGLSSESVTAILIELVLGLQEQIDELKAKVDAE